MDRQIEQEKITIPVNTRTIGMPGGAYVLYIEDYVHTFIRKFLDESNAKGAECRVRLYGYVQNESGQCVLMVSGAVQDEDGPLMEKGQQIFTKYQNIASAKISYGKNERIRFEITLENEKSAVLEDFYIYYDQNEEMQNYLIEWNLSRCNIKNRTDLDDVSRFGRLTQAYNKEEAKVSFLWSMVNVLSLSLIVCVMAYAVISINNYHKMQDMQATLDYVVAVLSEDGRNLIPDGMSVGDAVSVLARAAADDKNIEQDISEPESEIISQMNSEELTEEISETISKTISECESEVDNMSTDNDTQGDNNTETVAETTLEELTQQAVQTEADLANADTTAASASTETADTENTTADSTATANNEETANESDAQTTPQYYTVQEGDTLQSISYKVYGTYKKVNEICEWNKLDNPDNILYGQRLLLP